MTEMHDWYEKWTTLPLTLRHLLLYLLYASGNKEDGVECVLTCRALLETKSLEESCNREVFNVRDGVRVSQWVPPPIGLFDELLEDLNEQLDMDNKTDVATLKLLTPMCPYNVIVQVRRDHPTSVYVRFLASLEPAGANAMVESIGKYGMHHLCIDNMKS